MANTAAPVRRQENYTLFNATPGIYGPFELSSGQYATVATATWGGGNVQLQIQSIDGTTWLNATSAVNSNGFSSQLFFPEGIYQLVVTTATAVYYEISKLKL